TYDTSKDINSTSRELPNKVVEITITSYDTTAAVGSGVRQVGSPVCAENSFRIDFVVAVGTRIAPRPPHRSRRALLTHRAPPSGRTSASAQHKTARDPAHSRHSGRRGVSAQCPNHGRLSAVPLG